MDEPARRVLHRFKHGDSVQQYRGEFRYIFITLFRTKMPKYVLNLCVTWTANTEKILDFRIGPKIGPIQCSKGDKYLYLPHMSG